LAQIVELLGHRDGTGTETSVDIAVGQHGGAQAKQRRVAFAERNADVLTWADIDNRKAHRDVITGHSRLDPVAQRDGIDTPRHSRRLHRDGQLHCQPRSGSALAASVSGARQAGQIEPRIGQLRCHRTPLSVLRVHGQSGRSHGRSGRNRSSGSMWLRSARSSSCHPCGAHEGPTPARSTLTRPVLLDGGCGSADDRRSYGGPRRWAGLSDEAARPGNGRRHRASRTSER